MEKIKILTCKKHGETEHTLTKDGRWRCKKCFIEHSSTKKRRTKEKLVEYKGGKCEICGYDKCIDALEFHHLNPKEKEFNISQSNYSKPFALLKKEVDKCILVCSNCHREIHANIVKKNRENRDFDCLSWTPIDRKTVYNTISAEKILELHNNGISEKDICKIINVSISTLKRFLKDNNISFKKEKKPLKKDLEEIFDLLKSTVKVSEYYNTSYTTVKQWCIDYNIPYKEKDIKQKVNYKLGDAIT